MSGSPEDHDTPSDELAERKMRFLFALRSRGVTDTRVLTAMERVDRGLFVRGLFADRAYEDMPLPIACGQPSTATAVWCVKRQTSSASWTSATSPRSPPTALSACPIRALSTAS